MCTLNRLHIESDKNNLGRIFTLRCTCRCGFAHNVAAELMMPHALNRLENTIDFENFYSISRNYFPPIHVPGTGNVLFVEIITIKGAYLFRIVMSEHHAIRVNDKKVGNVRLLRGFIQ